MRENMHFTNITETLSYTERSNAASDSGRWRKFLSRKTSCRKVAMAIGLCVVVVAIAGTIWHFASQTSTPTQEEDIRLQYATTTESTTHTYTAASTTAKRHERRFGPECTECTLRDLFDVKEHVNAVKDHLDAKYNAVRKQLDELAKVVMLNRQEGANASAQLSRHVEKMIRQALANNSGLHHSGSPQNQSDHSDVGFTKQPTVSKTVTENISTSPNITTEVMKSITEEVVTQVMTLLQTVNLKRIASIEEKVNRTKLEIQKKLEKQTNVLLDYNSTLTNWTALLIKQEQTNLQQSKSNVTSSITKQTVLGLIQNETANMKLQDKFDLAVNECVSEISTRVSNQLSHALSLAKNLSRIETLERQVNVSTLAEAVSNLTERYDTNIPLLLQSVKQLDVKIKMASTPDKPTTLGQWQNATTVGNEEESKDLCDATRQLHIQNSNHFLQTLNNVIHQHCSSEKETLRFRQWIQRRTTHENYVFSNFTRSLGTQRRQLGSIIRSLVQQERNVRSNSLISMRKRFLSQQNANQQQMNRIVATVSASNKQLKSLTEAVQQSINVSNQCEQKISKKLDKGWIQAPNGYAYMLTTGKITWYSAIVTCVSKQGHLAYIGLRSQQLHKLIYESIILPVNTNVWIGLDKSISTRTWKWLDGQDLTNSASNWARGQPSQFRRTQACVAVTPFMGKWNDLPCTSRSYALCEKLSRA